MCLAIDQLLELSVPEKLDVLEQLWDSIIANPKQFPIPDWHLEELDRREVKQQWNPQVGEEWAGVKQRLLDRNA